MAPERLQRWIEGFAQRHGELRVDAGDDRLTLAAADGSVAECHVPFPPLGAGAAPDPVPALVAHALRERTAGVLLVRLGGYAVAVVEGPRLEASEVGSRPVHGRSAAGGWSQQRFARRRENQATEALQAAADHAARILLPAAPGLDALATGGDRHAVETVLADPRLATLRALPHTALLDVPTPNRHVLEAATAQLRAVRIRLSEPDAAP